MIENPTELAGRPENERGSILVVEDEALVRMGVVDELLQAGYSILEASTADEAIALLEGGAEVDLVFSDIQMPGALDGVALLRVVKERFPSVSVILTSGHVKPPPETMGEGTIFVPKPYQPGDLLAVLKTAIDGGRSVAARAT